MIMRTLPRVEPRRSPWMDELFDDVERCRAILDRHGSPVHIHHPRQLESNLRSLVSAAVPHGVEVDVFFARKANRALAYVDAALAAGTGIDVASIEELEEVVQRGALGARIVVTAAVKSKRLIERALEVGARLVVDNAEEFRRVGDADRTEALSVDVRLGGAILSDRPPSRFGFDPSEAASVVDLASQAGVDIGGVHFHIDGYDPMDRVEALRHAIRWVDRFRGLGHSVNHVDIGGGIPVRYAESAAEWRDFESQLRSALAGDRPEVSYRNHGFGLFAHRGEVLGQLAAYPHATDVTAGHWMSSFLRADLGDGTQDSVGDALRARRLVLRLEPGRYLVDQCGVTIALVEHRKGVGGDVHLGLAMNSSNCRSQKSELLTDPVFIGVPGEDGWEPGYLTGAYCAESELITHRRLAVPAGVDSGHVVGFANTAGYLMHFIESRSHQFPLPANLVLGEDEVVDGARAQGPKVG